MKGASARVDRSWIAWAISSLPVPDSPRINTGDCVRATIATLASKARIAGLSPMKPSIRTGLRMRAGWSAGWACCNVSDISYFRSRMAETAPTS
jgi:hypothetical protein